MDDEAVPTTRAGWTARSKPSPRSSSRRSRLEGAKPKTPAPADQTYFGFTFGALFLGLIISTVGIGYIRYAKVTSQLSPFIVGAALVGMTFFIKDARILAGCAGGVIGLQLVARRYVRF